MVGSKSDSTRDPRNIGRLGSGQGTAAATGAAQGQPQRSVTAKELKLVPERVIAAPVAKADRHTEPTRSQCVIQEAFGLRPVARHRHARRLLEGGDHETGSVAEIRHTEESGPAGQLQWPNSAHSQMRV